MNSPDTVSEKMPPKMPLFKDFHHELADSSPVLRRQGARTVQATNIPMGQVPQGIPNVIVNLP